ncbi:MAG: UvrD-helicase domain-containing protein [Neisseriaceae bacterium]
MDKVSTSFLKKLNSEQLSAVTHPFDQSLLVLAGAGSGKTRVLISRIFWLLSTGRANTAEVLAVTFTNKAAKEMRSRLEALLGHSIPTLWLGTFHSLCHRLLRSFYKSANLSIHFQLLDTQDQLSIIKRLQKNNPASPPTSCTAQEIVQYINAQKEKGLRSQQISEFPTPRYRELLYYYQHYEELCQRENLVDFTELLLRCVEMLQTNPSLRASLQKRFRYVLVDEFQDTNDLQYQWLQLLRGEESVIFAVGDDDQSIYSFRGANVDNMQRLRRDFNIPHLIKLERNYRSTQTILEVANGLIAHNQNRIGKNLQSMQKQGEPVRYWQTLSDWQESQLVTNEINALHKEGFPYHHIAVLYRNNAQSRLIEQALFNANIPYKVYGGLRFYEREEIKHALAYLRLLVIPEDNQALLRVINFPPRGIGPRTVESLHQKAHHQSVSLWQVLEVERIRQRCLAVFYDLIQQLQTQMETLSFPQLMQKIIDTTGLAQHYREKKGDFQNKLDNLDELVSATNYLNPNEVKLLFSESLPVVTTKEKILTFLANASLEAGERNSLTGQQYASRGEAVQLMTIHSAKGLEFDIVFLIALEEGIFPSEYTLSKPDGLEEERRLMYVATTRAKQKLYLTSAIERSHRGKKEFSIQSRFINELPAHLVQRPLEAEGIHTTPFLAKRTLLSTRDKANAAYTIGSLVQHPKFGTGTIIDRRSKSHSYALTINFGKEGIKILDTAVAKLSLLS